MGRGYLTNNDFEAAFDWHASIVGVEIPHTRNDLECVIRRMNKDKLNGRVSMPEFVEELTPKAPLKTY